MRNILVSFLNLTMLCYRSCTNRNGTNRKKLKETLNCNIVIVRHVEDKLIRDEAVYLSTTVTNPDLEVFFDLNPKNYTSCQFFVQEIDAIVRYKQSAVQEQTFNKAGKNAYYSSI